MIGGGIIPAPLLAAKIAAGATIRFITHPGDTQPEPRYRASTTLARFVRCRDMTCRFPGCSKPADICDLDHTIAYPVGPTCASNLKCLCREHHLLKTFWAGRHGWQDRQLPDGTVIWTDPNGQIHTTRPGSYALFPKLCEPTAPVVLSAAQRAAAAEHHPGQRTDHADDANTPAHKTKRDASSKSAAPTKTSTTKWDSAARRHGMRQTAALLTGPHRYVRTITPPQYALAVPETSYAQCDGLSLAYQVFGHGPLELVFAGSFASHIELYWTVPEFVAFFERLSTFCRIVLFDKAGAGLSDPMPKVRTLDERAAEIESVMDAVGFERAVLFGASEGGPAALVFAATRPERTRALILTGSFAYSFANDWDDLERDPAELRARLMRELGEDYTPSVQQLTRWQAWSRAAMSAWGSGEAGKALLPSVRSIRLLAMVERMSASPGMARVAFEALFRIDVRPILPTITAPTLVIHALDEIVPVQCGRDIADHIPGARMLEVEGSDHAPWLADPDRILTVVEEFLTGSQAAPPSSRRALRAVLFTDMVGVDATRCRGRRRAVAGGAAPVRRDHRGADATIRRHGGGEHRRRSPHHVRRPDTRHPVRRGLAH